MSQADCIFCQIASKQAPASLVHEDARTLVFMDLFPVSRGHALIIPKAHFPDLFSANGDDLRAVIERSRSVAHALRKVLAPDGIGVYQLNGAAAGQTVFHYHVHLVPRMQGDPLTLHGRAKADPAELDALAARIGAAIED